MKIIKSLGVLFMCSILLLLTYSFKFIAVKGSGNVITSSRKIVPFTKINASRGVDVYLIQSDKCSVDITTDDNIMQYLSTKVEKGTLIIKFTENVRKLTTQKVYVNFVNLEAIKASSGAEIDSKKELNLGEIRIDASSGADIDLKIKADKCIVSSSSGSEIELEGYADILNITASSAGEVECDKLISNKCSVTASSAASCDVYVNNSLVANASSAAEITYRGNPKSTNVNSSTTGAIRARYND